MGYDLPGVYYRPDRGWSAPVRGLVGAQIHGDEQMAHMQLADLTEQEVRVLAVNLAGLCANLLALGPWGDGCIDEAAVVERWDTSTARLVAELSGYEMDDEG